MQMRDKSTYHLQRSGELKSARSNLESVWQDVDDYFGGGEGINFKRLPGQEKVTMSDSSPEQALLSYTRFLGDITRKRGTQWIKAKFDDDDLDKVQQLAELRDAIDDRMLRAINKPEARFAENAWKADLSLAKYAIAFMFEDENFTRNRLRFRTYSPRDCYIDEDQSGNLDTVFRHFQYNARQAKQRWGDAVHAKVKKAYVKNDPKKFNFLHVTIPNEDRKLYGIHKSIDKPFLTSYLDVENEHFLEESGYFENPWIIPRQNVMAGSIYGYSMAMSGLPDSRMLQFIADALMDATEYALNPTLMSYSKQTLRMGPGIINHYDPNQLQGRPPVEALQLGGDIAVGMQHQIETRQQMMKFFLEDVFSLPDRSNMTAEEIRRRNDDLSRVLGPMTDTLLPDYNGRIATRSFGIMSRRKQFVIEGQDYSDLEDRVQFEYENPVEQLQKDTEKAFMQETTSYVVNLASESQQPELLDNLDLDEITRDFADINLKSKYIVAKDKVDAKRAARAEQQQAAAAAQQMVGLSDAGASIAENLQVIEGGMA